MAMYGRYRRSYRGRFGGGRSRYGMRRRPTYGRRRYGGYGPSRRRFYYAGRRF